MPTKCIGCGVETEGSVGAAGIKWSSICQPCKDKADQALLLTLKIQAKICNLFESVLPEIAAKVQAKEVANG